MNLRRRIQVIHSFLRQRQQALQFEQLPDPRDPRGKRWAASTLWRVTLLSLMLLAKSLRSAERTSEDLAQPRNLIGLKRRVPTSTLGDFLSRAEPQPLREHLHTHILAEHRRKALEPTVLPIRAISIDGKTLAVLGHQAHPACQQQNPEGQAPLWNFRVLNATLISSAAAVGIDQLPIPADTNETGLFARFFSELVQTYGRAELFELVCADAGLTSLANATLVDAAHKAYFFALKGNQPELEAEAKAVLLPLTLTSRPEAETDWELDSSRGWIKRQLWRTTELAQWGAWSHLRQVILVRVLRRGGPPSSNWQGPEQILEQRFYVTNLPLRRLSAKGLLDLVRAHWRIENNLHGSLDIQWEEDHGRWVHRQNGLPVMGLLRMLAYNLLALLRSVHLRSAEGRQAAWQQLRDWMRDALLWFSRTQDVEEVDSAPI